jgi:hypothetical protein
MPVKRAKKVDIVRRRDRVADLYVQGLTQCAIAEELGVHQPTVCDDLKKIQRQWRESTVRNFDEAKEMELQKLDRVEREAWAAWERSQKPAQSTTVEGDGTPKRSRKTISQRNGDPRYLDTVLKCVAARRAILGLDAPTKIAPTTPDGQPLSFDQRQIHVNAILVERFGLHVLGGTTDERETSDSQRCLVAPNAAGEPVGCGTAAIESTLGERPNERSDQEAPSAASGVPDAHV